MPADPHSTRTRAEAMATAREIFKDFHILGRKWLDIAEQTHAAGDFDAMLAGAREPTAVAAVIRRVMDDIAAALTEARAAGARAQRAMISETVEGIMAVVGSLSQKDVGLVMVQILSAIRTGPLVTDAAPVPPAPGATEGQ